MIWRIGVDAAGRWLVSASIDKTLRVWSLADGQLAQTLRVPMGTGNEGKLYAAAISPDGTLIAAGGWDWDDSIYIFNRASGQMVRRIGGLGNVIQHLAFSADGRYLAASLGDGGLRVFRSDNGQQVAEDRDYGGHSYWCDFAADGRLVTSSWDGYLRLYDARFQLQAKQRAQGGSQPVAAVFSPDGRRIAVGFGDSTRVVVLDGQNLSLAYEADSSGVDNGHLGSVAWSADGASLYAGGLGNNFKIRRWSEGGRGSFRDLPVSGNTIMDIRPLPGGAVAVGSGDPAITLLARDGSQARQMVAGIADYRDNWEGFLLSHDGAQVKFGFEVWGKRPASFDLSNRSLSEPPATTSGLTPPDSSSLNISDWKYTTHPQLNGQPLKLDQYETSRSLAIAPDRKSFLLGANWYLRRFDGSGKELWRQAVPGDAWGVNISGDGKKAVAAFGDGTIRWYDYATGAELLALFPHADGKRWIVWTPSGYYDAAPGSEDLIGWHINSGKDAAAAFYPASKFRERFYRPDVVARVLDSGSEAEAIRLANAEAGRRTQQVSIAQILPPTVAILSPASGSGFAKTEVTLRVAVDSPADAPLSGIRVRANGQLLRDARLVPGKGAEREVVVTLPKQDVEILLFGENRNGISTAATARLSWVGSTPVAANEEDRFKPKLYVLAVGVSKYQLQGHDLELAAKDATDFSAVFQKQKGKLYNDVQVRLLTDEHATKDDVLDGLEWLRAQVTSHDVGIMFLAGHGMNDPSNGKYYFLPHDVNPNKLLRTGVSQGDIQLALNTMAGKVLFFIDSCHSGNALGTAKTRGGADINAVINELSSAENGVVVFAASTGRQLSQESADWNNGAFTKAVVEGLTGKADVRNTGRVTIKGLDFYVADRVKELTHGQQTPVSIAPKGVTDFPISVQ